MFTERGNFNLQCMHFCVNFPFIVIVFIFLLPKQYVLFSGGQGEGVPDLDVLGLSYDIHVEDKVIPK